MSEPSRIEYEALAFEVFAEEHLGYLVIAVATSDGQKVALRMRRSTFDDLAVQIAGAKACRDARARGE
jgi:hypothetical protein